MGYIYLITNTVTKKQYVGQTLCSDVETRWKQHKSPKCNTVGRYLSSAYKKHGIDKFKFQIICICFDKDCNIYEEEYIKKFNTLVPNGYNLREGGKNSRQHPETIQKISDKLKGRRLTLITDEIRKKISESAKGEKNSNYGKKNSEERRKVLSEGMKKLWEGRKKNGIFNISNNKNLFTGANKKAVGKYDDNGNLLEQFDSTVNAGKIIGIHHSTISKVCNENPKYKRAGGFIWKFISDQILIS
jgi:group I intron endonuclease